MAKGILALLGEPKGKGDAESDDDGEPSSVKARAVRDMFRAADEEDWDAAAEAFHRAYVECMKKLEKPGDEADDTEPDADLDDEE